MDLIEMVGDEVLVARASAGDLCAFDVLFARHRPSVVRVAGQVVGAAADAEDVAQLTFVKALRGFERFDPDRSFGPWVRTIAKRLAIDLVRSQQRRKRLVVPELEAHESAEVTFDRQATRDRVRAAVALLPEPEQIVVQLTYLDGLTHRDASSALGIPVGTIKSRSNRAVRRLGDILQVS